jgi:tetratricopeptide (TPR) repeat protein
MKILITLLIFLMLASQISQAQKEKASPKKEVNKAYIALIEASDLKTADTTLALQVAAMAKTQNDTLKNIVYAQRALSSGAKNLALFQSLSLAYQDKKLYQESLNVLDKGLSLYPNHTELLSSKVSVLLASKPIENLIQDYEQNMKEAPNKMEALQILAILYRNSGDPLQSKNYFKTLQKQNPESFDTNYQLAVFYYNQAVEIKKASDRMDIDTYNKEGIAIEKQAFEKFRESIKYFEKANAIQKDEGIQNNLNHLYTLLKVDVKDRKF